MTAGEVHQAGDAPSGRSATHSIRRGLPALGDAQAAPCLRSHGDDALVDGLLALITAESAISATTRQAIDTLLQRHRQLVADVARLRQQREELVVSALTYKALFERYSGQSPHEPNDRLMREKDSMRRAIRDQLRDGLAPAAIPSHSIDSLSLS